MLRFNDTVHARRGNGIAADFYVNPILHLRNHVRDLDSLNAYSKNSEAGVVP